MVDGVPDKADAYDPLIVGGQGETGGGVLEIPDTTDGSVVGGLASSTTGGYWSQSVKLIWIFS
jgi:hypothetical protein